MGRRPARHDPRGRPLRRLVLPLLLGVLLLGGCTSRGGAAPSGPPPLDRLSSAIRAVATARLALLGGVSNVQAGAKAVDATDAICAQGHGVAARTSRRAGTTSVTLATMAVHNLPTLISNYRASLTALGKADTAVSGTRRAALEKVVEDGGAEADAMGEFARVMKTAWTQYASLDGQQKVWIKRAVTPWYRTDQEGANAYAVLVGPFRPLLTVARTQLASASRAVRGPIAAQAATLAAADRALSGLRKPTPTPTLAG